MSILIAIAMYSHEIPCEIVHTAVLIKGKYSQGQTIVCSLLINLMGMIGVLTGLGLGQINKSVQSYFMAVVGGNFLYVSLGIISKLMRKNVKLNLI